MKNKLLTLLIISSTFVMGVTSCNSSNNNQDEEVVCGVDTEYETPITDAFSFKDADSISKDNFVKATSGLAISEVEVVSFTDGDTTTFRRINDKSDDSNNNIKVRYQGIDTPESTGKIEAWGIKASHFTKSKLRSASRIVVVNDLDLFGKTDSSGGRYMGFVWYLKEGSSSWRLLNLEIVEQGYSRNQLYQDSSILDGYYDAFKSAGKAAVSRRVNGEKDCDFDATSDVVETTIFNAKKNFDTLGVQDSSASSGKMIRVTGIVTGLEGSNFYLRDLVLEDGETVKAGIYVFTQYKSTGVKVGNVVRFYARITKYYSNYQLTDVQLNIASKPFEILATTKEGCEALGYEYDYEAIDVDESTISSLSDLEPYLGNKIKVDFVVDNDENYFYQSKTSESTYYLNGSINNVDISLRFASHPFFSSESVIKQVFEKGETYEVSVVASTYQYSDSDTLEYQLQFPSFSSGYKNYVNKK